MNEVTKQYLAEVGHTATNATLGTAFDVYNVGPDMVRSMFPSDDPEAIADDIIMLREIYTDDTPLYEILVDFASEAA